MNRSIVFRNEMASKRNRDPTKMAIKKEKRKKKEKRRSPASIHLRRLAVLSIGDDDSGAEESLVGASHLRDPKKEQKHF